MSEEESGQDIALIGLGGAGIKTMLALRALIENEESSGRGSRGNSCRLLAIDSNYLAQDYFRSLDDRDHENLLLAQNEYLGLLRNGENPWDKVTTDAKSNIPEAVKLYSQRRAIEINRSPDRSDYEAMIYVSRERMKQGVRDFLKNSEKSNKHSARPITLMIVTSSFGDTGSLSYLALLEILTELSEEIRCESINAFLFAPEGFRGFFHLNDSHTAKYLSVIHSLSGFRFNESSEKIVPTQYLVSLDAESHVGPFPSVFEIFTETAKKLHGLIVEEFASDNRVQDDGGDSIIEVERLNLEKCLEIKNSFVDRLAADRHFSQLVQGYPP
jgi:hypothetical protein